MLRSVCLKFMGSVVEMFFEVAFERQAQAQRVCTNAAFVVVHLEVGFSLLTTPTRPGVFTQLFVLVCDHFDGWRLSCSNNNIKTNLGYSDLFCVCAKFEHDTPIGEKNDRQ